jgi:hypothetical protein
MLRGTGLKEMPNSGFTAAFFGVKGPKASAIGLFGIRLRRRKQSFQLRSFVGLHLSS